MCSHAVGYGLDRTVEPDGTASYIAVLHRDVGRIARAGGHLGWVLFGPESLTCPSLCAYDGWLCQ